MGDAYAAKHSKFPTGVVTVPTVVYRAVDASNTLFGVIEYNNGKNTLPYPTPCETGGLGAIMALKVTSPSTSRAEGCFFSKS